MDSKIIIKQGLKMPKSYLEVPGKEKEEKLNKCGGDGLTSYLVPNNILGIEVGAACNIHDWMYLEGKNKEDKRIADKVFKENLTTLINQDVSTRGILGKLRNVFADIYSWAASFFGHLYY